MMFLRAPVRSQYESTDGTGELIGRADHTPAGKTAAVRLLRRSITSRGLGQQQLFEQLDFLGIVRVDALEQASQCAA
jgi:hypothetical protein